MEQETHTPSSSSPPGSPCNTLVDNFITRGEAKEMFIDLLRQMADSTEAAATLHPTQFADFINTPEADGHTCSSQSHTDSGSYIGNGDGDGEGSNHDALPVTPASSVPPTEIDDIPQESVKARRASRLEFKKIREVYDKTIYRFKIMIDESQEIEELDTYVFVVRFQTDRDSKEKTFIDIKSECLRDALREVFEDVNAVNLRDDKPSLESIYLFQFLPELQAYRNNLIEDSHKDCAKHTDLLLKYLVNTYASLSNRLETLLQHGEITYDLLPVFFKPNMIVFTHCHGTDKPRCVKFRMGEEKTSRLLGTSYSLDCRFIDFDGSITGKAAIELNISKFSGVKKIALMRCFPLQYHPEAAQMKANLIQSGQKFHSLRGSHHQYCEGKAFLIRDGFLHKRNVNSRIMVDAEFFRQMNPNYTQPKVETSSIPVINLSDYLDSGEAGGFERGYVNHGYSDSNIVKKTSSCCELELSEGLTEEDYLICSPTVPGFCLGDKLWYEFAVMDIKDIKWSHDLFRMLNIPQESKDVIMASAITRLGEMAGPVFDDIVPGKGRGLIVLLYGLPGLGKTLTAEAVAEEMMCPLYTVSAGELLHDANILEEQLLRIFAVAHHWKALLLLDEADVFLEARSHHNHYMNGTVAVFLRMLEWFRGVLFLTTNRASDFDPAILSRVHIVVDYQKLNQQQRMQIWRNFLERASTVQGPPEVTNDELEDLGRAELNGRQIKNIVSGGHALATVNRRQLGYSDIQRALTLSQKFMEKVDGRESLSSVFN